MDNTLIIYTADHGSTVGVYHMWDKGVGMYDCIYRIPLIVSYPSIQPNVSSSFVSLLDLANTILDFAGCDLLSHSDGKSLMPILQGEENFVRDDFIVCQAYGHQLPFWQRMIRTKTEKYIYNPTDKDEFYDLNIDPWEKRNIVEKVTKTKLKQIKEILQEQMEQTEDPLKSFTWSDLTL